MEIFKDSNFDFIKWRWHAVAMSTVLIVAGAALMASRGGLPLGIDFSGGTIVVVKFESAVSDAGVREAITSIEGEKVVQAYGQPQENEKLIRLPQIEGVEEGASLEQGANAVVAALDAADLPGFELISTDIVGPVIGRELQLRGIYATLASLLGIAVYIAFRFRMSFAVGAIVATFHDVLMTLAFLSFFGYELSLNVVAAILAITGYSVNDTIVVFDRVRENYRTMRRDSLSHIINASVNQTLSRTLITSITTFAAVLMLFLFGGEVLHGFAFTMLVGVVSGTYSTVFIAAAIAIILSKGRRVAPAAAPGPRATRRSKGRKARASQV